jgi:hypothetical protein
MLLGGIIYECKVFVSEYALQIKPKIPIKVVVTCDCPKLDLNQWPQGFQPCALPTELLELD